MQGQVRSHRQAAAFAAALVLAAFAAGPAFAQGAATVIRGAAVFTGDEVIETATVTIRGRTIEAVAAGDALPPAAGDDAVVVDGRGMTLLPGLIDAHTHSFGPALEDALNFGVTTVLDMFTEPTQAAAWRREQAAGPVTGRADLFSAGVAVTVENGHGTQFGVPIPTLDDPEQTEAFIAARVSEGSDWIKVVYEHGETSGRPVPTLDASTLPRIVAAARAHGKLAVFHVSTAREAKEAIAAGADGLVHVWHDRGGAGEAVAAAVQAEIVDRAAPLKPHGQSECLADRTREGVSPRRGWPGRESSSGGPRCSLRSMKESTAWHQTRSDRRPRGAVGYVTCGSSISCSSSSRCSSSRPAAGNGWSTELPSRSSSGCMAARNG